MALMDANTTGRILLARLETLPRLAVPALALVLMLVGLMAPPLVALPALTVLLALIAWLASLSWPHADGRGRAVRAAVVGVLAALWLVRLAQAVG